MAHASQSWGVDMRAGVHHFTLFDSQINNSYNFHSLLPCEVGIVITLSVSLSVYLSVVAQKSVSATYSARIYTCTT